MTRRIIAETLETIGQRPVDTYFDRVVKYIPADVVAAWVATLGIVKSGGGDSIVLWVAFVFGLVITFLWVLRNTTEPGKPRAYTQCAISTAAFAVWVFALGEPFASAIPNQAMFGALLLIAFTLTVGLVVPKEA